MNIGYFNARGINDIENWFKLEIDELRSRGHDVRTFSIRGRHPNRLDIHEMDFAHYHFAQVADSFKRTRVPFAISPHANDIFVDEGETLKRASEHPKCKFVTYQSFYHKRKFEEWGIDKPLVYLPMCARTELFNREKKYNPDDGIVAGGRLIPKKGLDRLKGVDNLTVFGDGPLQKQLQKKLRGTLFTGHLSGEDLRDLFENSSLYLFPSLVTPDGDSDGIPNTIKEAMLMELPVLASPVAGIPELENISLISDWSNIKETINNKDLYSRNWKGRQEILKTYSPHSCVDRLLEAIEIYG